MSKERERFEKIAKLVWELLVAYKHPVFVGASDDKKDISYAEELYAAAWKSVERYMDFCDAKMEDFAEEKPVKDAVDPGKTRIATQEPQHLPALNMYMGTNYCTWCKNSISEFDARWSSNSLQFSEQLFCCEACLNKALNTDGKLESKKRCEL